MANRWYELGKKALFSRLINAHPVSSAANGFQETVIVDAALIFVGESGQAASVGFAIHGHALDAFAQIHSSAQIRGLGSLREAKGLVVWLVLMAKS